jgi:apolipoprotein N-acyltransferase
VVEFPIRTLAIEQHIQITRMRALEMGRPILRVANTGVTTHINAFGKIQARLPLGMEGVLSGHVQGFSGMTFYGSHGDGLLWVLVLPIFLAFFYRRSITALGR